MYNSCNAALDYSQIHGEEVVCICQWRVYDWVSRFSHEPGDTTGRPPLPDGAEGLFPECFLFPLEIGVKCRNLDISHLHDIFPRSGVMLPSA